MIHADYLTQLVALAERKFGASAPETLALRRELEQAQLEQEKPAKEHLYHVGVQGVAGTASASTARLTAKQRLAPPSNRLRILSVSQHPTGKS
jgi:hypothetical protein